ncbi:MAG: hypothetical protein A3K19_32815 [Lentisphaerae bacterium RIFOXYB12_FULL_65_16]|nr:MAG: hypothetical protein A3K18_20315 [Lentisphaerae bacterium RIFOXYA12_64_32]OGV84526.1 MAG: hypothetical protein A3K19_32815 [Lentisphaerae bacterium RIFOXYB12_FULL_65_16]
MVFQSLPRCPLVDAIEGATGSAYSHCGIVVKSNGKWMVLEAIGPVTETSLYAWVNRGRGGAFDVYRVALSDEKMTRFIAEARKYLGRPYDVRYQLDDERIYCSELIYKAYLAATGEEIAPLVKLGDLNWKAFEQTIRQYEGGDPPLDRMMITPVAVSTSPKVTRVKD